MKEDAMNKLDELCVNTIRMLSVDCIENANSGHPGMPIPSLRSHLFQGPGGNGSAPRLG